MGERARRRGQRIERLERAVRVARIGRWLGPWAAPERAPHAHVVHDEGRRWLRVFHDVDRPAGAGGPTVLLLPGLHFLGPDDARFLRFASVLAATGAEVVAPYLSDFMALQLAPRLFDEAAAALDFAAWRSGGPVGVMSISFGSIVALRLAAEAPALVHRVVTFGGYRRYETAVRYALGGAVDDPAGACPAELRDPLNGPAVFANLADELLPEAARAPFREAALAFSRATWRGSADKRDGRHLIVGERLAATLDGDARALFRAACRLDRERPEPLALAEQAIVRARERIAYLDPGPLLPRVAAPVSCVHGRDDDVIPWTESVALARELPRGEALVTGLYGHTGHAAAFDPAALAREASSVLRVLAREASSVLRVLGALADLTG